MAFVGAAVIAAAGTVLAVVALRVPGRHGQSEAGVDDGSPSAVGGR